MSDEPPDVKPADLAKARVPDPVTQTEKEVFEGRIRELLEEVATLKAEIKELKKGSTPAKKKSLLERFAP